LLQDRRLALAKRLYRSGRSRVRNPNWFRQAPTQWHRHQRLAGRAIDWPL